jgi:hypothetical protein
MKSKYHGAVTIKHVRTYDSGLPGGGVVETHYYKNKKNLKKPYFIFGGSRTKHMSKISQQAQWP